MRLLGGSIQSVNKEADHEQHSNKPHQPVNIVHLYSGFLEFFSVTCEDTVLKLYVPDSIFKTLRPSA